MTNHEEARDALEQVTRERDRLREALAPFAAAADDEKSDDMYGAICFSQKHLKSARAALEDV